jgi:hypothetical protein
MVFCAVPEVKLSVAGEAVTPVGSPVIETAIEPLKELTAVARTLTREPAAPAAMVSDVGETVNVKSGGGGGGAEWEPPHATNVSHSSDIVEIKKFAKSSWFL